MNYMKLVGMYQVLDVKMIKSKDCKLDTKVMLSQNAIPFPRGKIVSQANCSQFGTMCVIVEWDDGKLERVALDFLYLEREGLVKEAELAEKLESIEKEWIIIKNKIKYNLDQATELIKYATEMSYTAGYALEKAYDCDELLDVIAESKIVPGWTNSSRNC